MATGKTKQIVQWVLTGIVVFILFGSGLVKLSGSSDTAEMATALGGTKNMMMLGVVEMLIATLFLIPRTSIIAFLLMVSYFGGAIAVHFVGNEPLIVPVAVQILIWITGFIKFTELKNRIVNKLYL